MADSKHTPGPWKVGGATEWDAEYGGDADAYSTQPISADGFETVCIVVGLNDEDAKFDANTRLIAAAPELLAALKAVDPFGDLQPAKAMKAGLSKGEQASFDEIIEKVRAAIAKAEGK